LVTTYDEEGRHHAEENGSKGSDGDKALQLGLASDYAPSPWPECVELKRAKQRHEYTEPNGHESGEPTRSLSPPDLDSRNNAGGIHGRERSHERTAIWIKEIHLV
jgi:hypothetical protein